MTESSKTYLIADTHLKHEKMKTYCQRPANFTSLIDRNVRNTLRPQDTLIHLGDVGIGKTDDWADIVKGWDCRRILIEGNHDEKSPTWYTDKGLFHFACKAMIYRGAWLTHKPSDVLPPGCSVNVHGHLHNVWDGFVSDDPEAKNNEFYHAFELGRLPRPYQRLFAVEYTNYMPVEFDKFIQKAADKYKAVGPRPVGEEGVWQTLL